MDSCGSPRPCLLASPRAEKTLERWEVSQRRQIVDPAANWKQLIAAEHEVLIIIDETQRLYPNDGSNSFPFSWASDFWTDMKDFQSRQSARTTKVRLLCLVTYPTTVVLPGYSPFNLAQTESLTMRDSLLTKTETEVLVERWQALRSTPVLSPMVRRRVIFRLTGGHVGCVMAILNLLRDKTDAEVEAVLMPDKLAQQLFGEGGAMRLLVPANPDIMELGSREVIQKLLFRWDGVSKTELLKTDGVTPHLLTYLEKSGQVVINKDAVHLIAPLMHFYWCSRLRTSKSSDGPQTIDELVTELIEAIDPEVLQSSLSRAPNSPHLEAAWQFEVYRAVHSRFPASVNISPGVGHGYNTAGAVDFVVNGPRGWAIEIMREGDRCLQHLARFEQGGEYWPLIQGGVVKQWRIIAFRRKIPKPTSYAPNLVFAVYNDDFTEYTVFTTPQGAARNIVATTALIMRRNSSILAHAEEATPPVTPSKP